MFAYAMRITALDPLEHGLIFERFLNPDRVSMPDFDIDFDERRRGEVIRYVTDKYGDDRVSMIVTYGTIKAKQAVKDSSRILGYAVRNIAANRGETVVLEDLPLTDETTYKLLQRGDTLGVFQLDGGPMRALLRSMRPDTFADISAVGALYRPGPMGANSHNEYARRKTGREP